MNTLIKLKSDLKRLATDNIGKVIQKLGNVLDDNVNDTYNKFILLKADFNSWQSDKISGTQTSEIINTRLAQLTERLLNFIDSISEKDVIATFHLKEEIYDKILVVCKIPERVEYMKSFFPEEYFVNLEYAEPGKKVSADKYDIVIFDNSPHDTDEGKHDLLRYFLDHAKPSILYFGGNLPLLYNYPEKVYATNSVFSIHARIKEMTEYLKYKNAASQTSTNYD